MTLELTPEQYKTLCKLVFYGEWMINSHRESPVEEFTSLEQSIYSKAKEAELENWVEYDEQFKQFLPTRDMEEELMPAIMEYDDFTFWNNLVNRLSERDAEAKYGKIEDFKDFISKCHEFSEGYYREFEENGLNNLSIK